jgi:hypothetical protein
LPFVRSGRIVTLFVEDDPVVIAGLLVAGVALMIGLAMARGFSRRSANRSDGLGKVSQRWLAVHRTEN